MSFIHSITHLFERASNGRRLQRPRGGLVSDPSVAAGQAGIYLRGLMEAGAGERNLEDIAATVPGGDHQRVQQFISDTPWDQDGVLDWVSAQADALLGGTPMSCLLVDESGFSKKGEHSAGVARQYNGRLGKVDQCQVGVFTALAAGRRACLLEGRLYLPEAWSENAARCEAAGIPEEHRPYKSKAQIALEMVRAQRRRGVRFGWVGFDAGYGAQPWFLRALEAEGEIFAGEVRSTQRFWLDNPCPLPPERAPGHRGRVSHRPQASHEGLKVGAWAAARPAEEWVAFKRRDGQYGPLRGEFLHRRVWLWDGREESPRLWHLLVWRPAESPSHLKYVLSNAPADTPVIDLARMAASRFWVERALQDAKGAAGMGEYQWRGWLGWHHHMAMVMLAMIFMLRERVLMAEELPLLSAEDIVWTLEHYLPRPHASEEEVQRALQRRHRRRQEDIDRRQRKNPPSLVDLL